MDLEDLIAASQRAARAWMEYFGSPSQITWEAFEAAMLELTKLLEEK